MWWLWIVGYLVAGVGVGFTYARQEVKTLIANPEKFRYEETTEWGRSVRGKELTEVQRIQRCAESVFWESWWVGVLWPLCVGAMGVTVLYDFTTRVILGKELTAARKKDEAKKADKILKEYEREQREKFDKELE